MFHSQLPTASPCYSPAHNSRRSFLQRTAAGVGLAWLTPLAEKLARASEAEPRGKHAKSVIVLWMEGGPSQLETFDPHPGTAIGGEIKAISTAAPDIKIADLYPLVAEQMQHISLVRSVMSKEGDHERGTYNLKTGWRPDPTVIHPSLGAVLCHQTKDNIEIPRHVSIYPNQWSARGGYLGDQFDSFRVMDPTRPIPDVLLRTDKDRYAARMKGLLNVVEPQFSRRRLKDLDNQRTQHKPSLEAADRMMSSDQLKAFDVATAPQALKDEFGDTNFGRGCLAAMQLIAAGVRCVEVSIGTWDSHANNHATHQARAKDVDPAFAALVRNLQQRDLLKDTIVLWMGEFGRTPKINGLGGRDHWPHGFTVALAGGGIRGGTVVGATSPEPKMEEKNWDKDIVDPQDVENIHATVLEALGINYHEERITPIGRPLNFSKGKPISSLLG